MTQINFNKDDDIEKYWATKLEKEFNRPTGGTTRERQIDIIMNYELSFVCSTDKNANIFNKRSKKFLIKTRQELENRKPISFKIDKNIVERRGVSYELFHIFISDSKALLENEYIDQRLAFKNKSFTDFCIDEYIEFDKLLFTD